MYSLHKDFLELLFCYPLNPYSSVRTEFNFPSDKHTLEQNEKVCPLNSVFMKVVNASCRLVLIRGTALTSGLAQSTDCYLLLICEHLTPKNNNKPKTKSQSLPSLHF